MFVNYLFATGAELPPIGPHIYEYVVDSHDIFVRARRHGLEALIWVGAMTKEIRGLGRVEPYLRIESRVPESLVRQIVQFAVDASPNEILFYLPGDPWRLVVPVQKASPGSVRPEDPYNPAATDALIEVHSHHDMPAYFSRTDDRDEGTGFRVFAVIGNLHQRPSILARVGIYGHFWNVPANWIFDLPDGVFDALQDDELPIEEGIPYDDSHDPYSL